MLMLFYLDDTHFNFAVSIPLKSSDSQQHLSDFLKIKFLQGREAEGQAFRLSVTPVN